MDVAYTVDKRIFRLRLLTTSGIGKLTSFGNSPVSPGCLDVRRAMERRERIPSRVLSISTCSKLVFDRFEVTFSAPTVPIRLCCLQPSSFYP